MCLTICALPVTHTNVCFDRRKKCRKKCNRVLLPTLCVCVCSSSGIQKRLEMIRSDVCFKPVTSVLFTAVRCPVYRCPTLKPGILKKQKIYLQINIDCKENHHHHHCAFHHLNLVTEADSLLCYCVQMYL